MALLHADTFDLGNYALRYTTSGTVTASTTTRNGAGRSLDVAGGAFAERTITASTDVYVGVAMRSSLMDATIRPEVVVYGDAGATRHMSIGLANNGARMHVGFPANALTASSTSSSFAANTWYWVEIYAKVADSGGRCVVKVDGNTILDYTGDTKNGGTNSTIDKVRLEVNGVGCQFDDFLIFDGTGTTHNTYPGLAQGIVLAPTGAGSSTGMTPSAGANWQTQDEAPYSTTDYVTGSSGQKDTYALADLPAGVGTILAVQTNVIAKKSDAGALSVRTVTRSGASDYTGTTTALATTDSNLITTYTTDPATSAAWTTSGVNALQAGSEVL